MVRREMWGFVLKEIETRLSTVTIPNPPQALLNTFNCTSSTKRKTVFCMTTLSRDRTLI